MQAICPHCQADVLYDEACVGQSAKCPMCHKPFRLPAPEFVEPKPPAPPPTPEPANPPTSNQYSLIPQGVLLSLVALLVGLAAAFDVLWLVYAFNLGTETETAAAWTHLILVVQAIILLMIYAAIRDR